MTLTNNSKWIRWRALSRPRHLRALRAYGLYMAGKTLAEIAKATSRCDGKGCISRCRASQLIWRGYWLVVLRCPERFPHDVTEDGGYVLRTIPKKP